MLKLFEIPEGSKIQAEIVSADGQEPRKDLITFHHLDGAYSYCTTSDGHVVHLSASTPLRLEGKHYVIEEVA